MFLELTGFPLIIVSLVAFIIIIGLIICIHEAGHFFVARKCGVLCHEFSIGMGPAIYKKKGKETMFCLRAIPIGGFVSMAGEQAYDELTKIGTKIGLNIENDVVTEIILDDNLECQIRGEITDKDLDGAEGKDLYITITDDLGETHYYQVKADAKYIFEKNETLQIAPYDRTLDAKPKWQRFLVLFAGAFMNFVLAFFVYLIVSFATGVPNLDSNIVGTVEEAYPAASYLVAGDQITKINGTNTNSWIDFQNELDKAYSNYQTSIELTYLHEGVETTVIIDTYTGFNSIGLSNYQAENRRSLSDIPGTDKKGLEVGNVNIRYKGEKGSLAKDDYLTKISIDGDAYEITSWSQLVELFTKLEVKTSVDIRFEYYHKGEDDTYSLVTLEECKSIEPYTDEVLDNQRVEKIPQMIGVAPGYHFSFFGCIQDAGVRFGEAFTLIFRTLKLLIAPSSVRQVGVQNLSSVVGIWGMVKSYIGAGFIPLLTLVGMLSVNIGIVNLLPIPALDGGRILFLLLEAISGKKVPKKIENIITLVFMGLLLALFVVITVFDVMRLVG